MGVDLCLLCIDLYSGKCGIVQIILQASLIVAFTDPDRSTGALLTIVWRVMLLLVPVSRFFPLRCK